MYIYNLYIIYFFSLLCSTSKSERLLIFADIFINKCLPVLTCGLEYCMLDSICLNSSNKKMLFTQPIFRHLLQKSEHISQAQIYSLYMTSSIKLGK